MSLALTDPKTLTHEEMDEGTVFAPRFDVNGLLSVVAVDAVSKDVLMLAHMNAEALELTLRTGIAHYWSRSRGKIWKKGETSGEVQAVVEIRTDCDQDALVMSVRQTGRGAACHTGRRTCFYRRLDLDGDRPVLADSGEPRLFDPKAVYG